MLERIARTLEAAALDEESRPLLKAGRLAAELEPAGFDSLAGFGIPPGRACSGRRATSSPSGGGRRRRRGAASASSRRRCASSNAGRREAEREAERAERTATEAREAADEARDAADAAAAELDDLS